MANHPTPLHLVRSLLPVLLVLVAAAALVGTWSWVRVPDPVDWDHPARWLARTTPEAALLAAGRIVVLAVAGWLLLSTLLALTAQACLATARAPEAIVVLARGIHRCSPAIVCHAVGGAVLVGLVTGASAPSPAPAGPRPSAGAHPVIAAVGDRPGVVPLGPVRDGRVAPGLRVPPSPPAPPPPAPAPLAPSAPSASSAPSAPSAPSGPPTAPVADRHVVRPGDSLWTIARDRLQGLGLATDDGAVGRYWRVLCDANRDGLTSGDVDLVYPGEPVDLPPIA